MLKKILIIEDEFHIRTLLAQTLETAFEENIENEELEIFEAVDGEKGIQIAKKERPALIFSDIMMPQKDGFQVCQEIRNDFNLKDSYFILLTAKGQEVDKNKGLLAGTNEYMTKPFNPEHIISKVEKILQIKRSS